MIHANNRIVAEKEQAKLQKLYPNAEIEIGHFGPVIGTHLGKSNWFSDFSSIIKDETKVNYFCLIFILLFYRSLLLLSRILLFIRKCKITPFIRKYLAN